jgi:sugar lactone lactonase YvrE
MQSSLDDQLHEPDQPETPEPGVQWRGWVGQDLMRPECVLTTRRGDIYTADWRSGVAHIRPDRQQIFYAAQAVDGETIKPNGIALRADGSFLLAHLGDEFGGVFHMQRNGSTRPVLTEVQGQRLPPCNFPLEDAQGRLWLSVSTRKKPRALGYRPDCDDGFIICKDARGARIVADGLGYTNELGIDPSGRWLYVNETFARKLSRFAIGANAELGPKELVCEFGAGDYPDGLAFDAQGGVWVVSIVSNRLLWVDGRGQPRVMLQDVDAEHLQLVEQAFQSGAMGRPHLDQVQSKCLKNISSLAFAGSDLKTAYLGCLLGKRLAKLAMPVAGHPPLHWLY